MMHLFSLTGGKVARRAMAAASLSLGFLAADASAQWCGPVCQPCYPCQPYTQPGLPAVGQPTPAESMMGATESMNPAVDPTQGQPSADDFAYDSGIGGAAAGDVNMGGYIDNAIVANRVRIRYDNVQGGNNDFAEFLYGAYGLNGNPFYANYDYNEVSTYLEYMLTCRLSVFVDVPFRAAEFDNLAAGGVGGPGGPGAAALRREAGIADLNAGFRYAVIDDGCDFVTAQLKVFVPTGNAQNVLGTGHASIQPGLLAQRDYDRLHLFGELHDWISFSNTVVDANDPNFAGQLYGGNVLRYGLGGAYDLARADCRKLQAVGELVGWTCLYGYRSTGPNGPANPAGGNTNVVNAAGETIVNFKAGLRYTQDVHSLYVGYGFPLTQDPQQLYDSIIRVDYTYAGW